MYRYLLELESTVSSLDGYLTRRDYMRNITLEAEHLELTHEVRWALNNASACRLQACLSYDPAKRSSMLHTAARYEAHAEHYQARLRHIESVLS